MGYLKDMGGRIQVRMKREHTNAKALASDLDMHVNTLGRIIRGETIPGIDKVVLIANVLNVSIDWLIFGRDSYGRNEFGDLPFSGPADIINNVSAPYAPLAAGDDQILTEIIISIKNLSNDDRLIILHVAKALGK